MLLIGHLLCPKRKKYHIHRVQRGREGGMHMSFGGIGSNGFTLLVVLFILLIIVGNSYPASVGGGGGFGVGGGY
jgi:uncharacterized protein (TIGR01732 family)